MDLQKRKMRPSYCDVLIVTGSQLVEDRLIGAVKGFGYTCLLVDSSDQAEELYGTALISLLILDSRIITDTFELSGNIQVLKQTFPDAGILVICSNDSSLDDLDWLKKSGANSLIRESEYLATSKLEFLLGAYIGGEFFSVKASDFLIGTKFDFSLYHLMTKNRKFLPILPKNCELDQERAAKLESQHNLFVRGRDSNKYSKYILANQGNSTAGLVRRARALFRNFSISYRELVIQITEQMTIPKYDHGRGLLSKCSGLASDLLTTLMSIEDVFEVLGPSVAGEFKFILRAPEKAAMAGFLCVQCNRGDADRAMVAALLKELGILALNPSLLRKLISQPQEPLHNSEIEEFGTFPKKSLDYILEQKLAIDQDVKNILLMAHSTFDEEGFPKVNPERIPFESQILLFVEYLDEICEIKVNSPRKSFAEGYREILSSYALTKKFSPVVIQSLKAIRI